MIISSLEKNFCSSNSIVLHTITLDILDSINLLTAGPDKTGCVATALTERAPFYIAVAAVLMGIVPYQQLNVPEPLALAFSYLDMNWAAGIVAFGAVVSTTAVLLVFQLGQPRIFFAMARDGLLPRQFAKVHARYQTPHVTTIITGVVVAFFAAFMDIGEAAELTNIGTLFAFVLVCAGVIILRWRQPGLNRPFRCPWVPLIPMLGIVICFYLMISLPWVTWVRFFVWLGIGMAIYLCYGRRHSKLVNQDRKN